MRRLWVAAGLIATLGGGLPAAAQDGCDDLWFTRNLLFDRVGYCFGSALGQAVFDNRDCLGTSVTLTPPAQRLATEIRRLEGVYGCRVDTGRRALSEGDWALRKNLAELPIRDEFESACLGFVGAPRALHAASTPGSAIVGRIEPGDYVSFAHYGLDGGTYVTTYAGPGGPPRSGGWLLAPLAEADCSQWAG